MTCEAFIITWNEGKIIRHTIEHYKQFCDKITVYDNMSTDNTCKILHEYSPFVEVISFDTGNKIDEREYLKIKNHCWKKSKANWVVVCDADEFLMQDLNETLRPITKEYLNHLKRDKVNIINPIGYQAVCRTGLNWSKPLFQQMQYFVHDIAFSKIILFNPSQVEEICYFPGCHRSHPIPTKFNKLTFSYKFSLIHYKYIDYNYVLKKHMAYKKRLSTFNRTRMYGAEYLQDEKFIQNKYLEFKNTEDKEFFNTEDYEPLTFDFLPTIGKQIPR